MASPSRPPDATPPERAPADDVSQRVARFTTRPGRVVFTEVGNIDGWIASDLTVEPLE